LEGAKAQRREGLERKKDQSKEKKEDSTKLIGIRIPNHLCSDVKNQQTPGGNKTGNRGVKSESKYLLDSLGGRERGLDPNLEAAGPSRSHGRSFSLLRGGGLGLLITNDSPRGTWESRKPNIIVLSGGKEKEDSNRLVGSSKTLERVPNSRKKVFHRKVVEGEKGRD